MKVLLYLIIAFAAVSCACSDTSVPHMLDEAQAILSHDPEGAFDLLNTCDVTSFGDSAVMARWALLYSEALVAKNIAAPTDTIINIAIDYYGDHNLSGEYDRALRLKSQMSAIGTSDALSSALYMQKEKEFMLYKERIRTERLIFAAILVFLLAAGVISWQRQRLLLNEALNESLISEASGLRESMAAQLSQCSVLESQLSTTLINRFGIIDELCSTYYESQGTKAEKKAIVDKVKAHIEAMKADEGIFSEMEACHGEMLALFRNECHVLKPDEYRMMVYLASGLSNRTIALLIGESIDVAYKRKSRLKAKITASSMPHKALFLSKF